MRKSVLVLLLVIASINLFGQEFTIYAIPAPGDINWSSPGALMRSYIRNSFVYSRYGKKKHVVGHVVVELKDSSRYALIGATASSKAVLIRDVFHRGYGVGALFAKFDGIIEDASVNDPELKERIRNGDIAFLRVKISKAVFNRLWRYMEEYKLQGYDEIYNGHNQPRLGRGAGCSALAVSFIEVAGLDKVIDTKDWVVQVAVQEKLIGGPEAHNRRVSVLTVLGTSHWADTTSDYYRVLKYYDPTIMFYDIKERFRLKQPQPGVRYTQEGASAGVEYDCRNYQVPEEPIWP